MNHLDSFETERLQAERLQEDHFELIHRMHQDERVMAHLGGPRSPEQTSDYMEQNLTHWAEHGYGIWILSERATGHFAGRGGLRSVVLGGKDEVDVLKKADFHFERDIIYKGTPSLLYRRDITRTLCTGSWTESELILEEVFDEARIQTVEKLAYEIWNEHFTPIIGKAQVDYMLEKFQSIKAISGQIEQCFQYYLIKTDEDYIGYTGVQPKEDELFLSKLYITASQRGKGYGRKIVQFLEGMARDKGLNTITLTVNKNNLDTIKAYEKFGFENLGPVVQDIGGGFVMDDYRMAKQIEQQGTS